MRTHHYAHLDLLKKCPRKWAAKHLHKLPDPKHEKAQEGIDVHELLDRMLTDGPQVNSAPESKIGGWARALYPLAPAGAMPEIGHTFDLFGYPCGFKIDWTAPGFAYFGDWKTCAGPKWALDTDGKTNVGRLQDDIQANLYAYGFMQVFGRTDVVLEWCYVDKKTAKSWKVKRTFTFAETEAWLRENVLPLIQLSELLRDLHSETEGGLPLSAVPFEMAECKRGGKISCNFLGHCQFKPATTTTPQLIQLAAQPKESRMSLAEIQAAGRAGQTTPAAPPPPVTFAPLNTGEGAALPMPAAEAPVAFAPPPGFQAPPSVGSAGLAPHNAPEPSAQLALPHEPPAVATPAETPAPVEAPKPKAKRRGAKEKLAEAEARIAELEAQLRGLEANEPVVVGKVDIVAGEEHRAAQAQVVALQDENERLVMKCGELREQLLNANRASGGEAPTALDIPELCAALYARGYAVTLAYRGGV